MKLLLALFVATLALFAAPAVAQTVTLEPGAICNAYCSCLDVPTDAGTELNYVTPTSVSPVPGVVFTGPAVYPSQMFDGAGHAIVVTLQFTRWTTKTVSGRGAGARIQHCALVGGTVTEQAASGASAAQGVLQKPWFVD